VRTVVACLASVLLGCGSSEAGATTADVGAETSDDDAVDVGAVIPPPPEAGPDDTAIDPDVPWSEVRVDPAVCESRPLACAPGEDPRRLLDKAMRDCGAWCAQVTATFDPAGCLTAVAFVQENLTLPLPECLRAKLEDARWSCARAVQMQEPGCGPQ
jgi:hypothetical protein